jgi:hypothetical protein
MCRHGQTLNASVLIPAHLSHTGEQRWDVKPIDRCLLPLIEELNRVGEHTIGSCCGHGKVPGSIIMADGRELTVDAAEALLKRHGLILGKRLHAADPGRNFSVAYYPEWDEFRKPLPG